ncbi:BAG family molecular chaperone regulator 7 [Apostasia shenzhenica]|uniref:BAG family molecular chaperone regulator 7 n=1 Tax=Apostasia shenzhenica TaxID=1088818 RepID=A0A2H9ZT71_9ASPA|nr:BAG family molecular chaperone regulator 7 [Apostasia shenzhenica]
MSAFRRLELLDPHSLRGKASLSSFISPFAGPVDVAGKHLEFDFDLFSPSSFLANIPHQICFLQHWDHLPLDFFDATADLIQTSTAHWKFHERAESTEFYLRSLSDRLAMLDLGIDRAFQQCGCKWTGEIKDRKEEGFDWRCKWTAKAKGSADKIMKWTIQSQGTVKPLSGDCSFHATAVPEEDVCERTRRGKKVVGAVARAVEIEDGTERRDVARRQALARRAAHKSKVKKKELSPRDAAMTIQKTFRDHLSRRSHSLRCLRDMAVAKSKLREIRALFSNFSYRHRIANDAEEQQRFSEKIIILLLTVDAIEGPHLLVRSAKRSMSQELEAMLEAVDPQPFRKMGSIRRKKFDLPRGSFSKEMASGVADVVQMLNQEDDGCSILPDISV